MDAGGFSHHERHFYFVPDNAWYTAARTENSRISRISRTILVFLSPSSRNAPAVVVYLPPSTAVLIIFTRSLCPSILKRTDKLHIMYLVNVGPMLLSSFASDKQYEEQQRKALLVASNSILVHLLTCARLPSLCASRVMAGIVVYFFTSKM